MVVSKEHSSQCPIGAYKGTLAGQGLLASDTLAVVTALGSSVVVEVRSGACADIASAGSNLVIVAGSGWHCRLGLARGLEPHDVDMKEDHVVLAAE